MSYFESGVRMSMYELALLHAAARARRVFVRGAVTRLFSRRPGEDARTFHRRLHAGAADEPAVDLAQADRGPLFAALLRGDVALPEGASCYAVFREQTTPTIAAADLIA
jgi:hypothetical protein